MPVIQKELPQWFLRTTAYAEEIKRQFVDLCERAGVTPPEPDQMKIVERDQTSKYGRGHDLSPAFARKLLLANDHHFWR
jgi:hypothetical protein